MKNYIEATQQFHARYVEPSLGAPIGCSEAEIVDLEGRLGSPLPEAYRQFLRWMGNDRNGIFVGSDCFLDVLPEINDALPDLLATNGVDFDLPERYLVFFLHQGYIAIWFALPATDPDPEYWIFNEGSTPRPIKDGRFSTWLREEIRALARASTQVDF